MRSSGFEFHHILGFGTFNVSEFIAILVCQASCASGLYQLAGNGSGYEGKHYAEYDPNELGGCYAGNDEDGNQRTQQPGHSMEIVDAAGVYEFNACFQCGLYKDVTD